MLGREPIIDCHDDARRSRAKRTAHPIMRVEAPENPATAVEIDQRGTRSLVTERFVDSDAHRAGNRPVDHRPDRIGRAEELCRCRLEPAACLARLRFPDRRHAGGCDGVEVGAGGGIEGHEPKPTVASR